MSDFDDVLERLLTDSAFKAQLAADPAAALMGYRLADDETELLRSQVSTEVGDHAVEQRTSKASLFGLLSPLAGMGHSLADAAGGGHFTHTVSGVGDVHPVTRGFDAAPSTWSGTDSGFGAADPQYTEAGFGVSHDQAGFGTSMDDTQPGWNGAGQPPTENTGFGVADAPDTRTPVGDYHTRVDADGDGKWDQHAYVARADGGIDIVVDSNHDGNADFIGHDYDRDGLIDAATTDDNHDGVFEHRYVDVNHDGWLDKQVPLDNGDAAPYQGPQGS